MMKRTVLAASVVCGLFGTVVPALAQQPSLADVARQEAARRQAVESSKKVYTDKDLNKGRPLTTGASAPAARAAEPKEGEAAAGEPADTEKATPAKSGVASDDPRIVELRLALATATEAANAAQLAVGRSNVSIVNLLDDSLRNAEIARRDEKTGEYRKYQANVDALTKQLAELEEAVVKAAAKAPPQ